MELESRASKTQRKSRHGVAANQRGSSRLKCICFNAGSVTGKADGLRAWIRTWNCDVVTISETWLREGEEWQGWDIFTTGQGEYHSCTAGGLYLLYLGGLRKRGNMGRAQE